MRNDQALALSDASERLIYAYVSGNKTEIKSAKEDLRLAQEMVDDKPADAVVARLIENDPVEAAAAGLLSFPELQAIVANDLEAHLTKEEAAVVADNPANLRAVLVARMNGIDLKEMVKEPLLDRTDFALAARGNRKTAAELIEMLRESLEKTRNG